ncbi:MAG: hypothetical protein Q7K42_02190 [Candidatus Diapherotrites archaeon]|nr:hypothetical protein [Candidatus Diapherotrites archaeon]
MAGARRPRGPFEAERLKVRGRQDVDTRVRVKAGLGFDTAVQRSVDTFRTVDRIKYSEHPFFAGKGVFFNPAAGKSNHADAKFYLRGINNKALELTAEENKLIRDSATEIVEARKLAKDAKTAARLSKLNLSLKETINEVRARHNLPALP